MWVANRTFIIGNIMTTNFDLEQQIMDCWGVVDDINTLYQGVVERDMTRDQVSNVLLGLNALYQLKFERCFETFERLLQENRKSKCSGYKPCGSQCDEEDNSY